MKAMVYTKAGYLDVLKVNDIPKPTPKDNQVLVAVKAGALSITDYERFKSLSDKVPLSTRITNTLLGFNDTPIGAEIAGIVVAVGKNITHVKVGDSVFGKLLDFFPKVDLLNMRLWIRIECTKNLIILPLNKRLLFPYLLKPH